MPWPDRLAMGLPSFLCICLLENFLPNYLLLDTFAGLGLLSFFLNWRGPRVLNALARCLCTWSACISCHMSSAWCLPEWLSMGSARISLHVFSTFCNMIRWMLRAFSDVCPFFSCLCQMLVSEMIALLDVLAGSFCIVSSFLFFGP